MQHIHVSDFMQHHPLTFTASMSLVAAVDLLVERGVSGGPVLNAQSQVIGFLSEQDCIRRMLMAAYYDETVALVQDVMKTNPMTVAPELALEDVAQLIVANTPKLYPVVDEDRRLLGVVSRGDVLKALDRELHSHYKR